MGNPRVFDGHGWVDVPAADSNHHTPVPPVTDGDGTIFVSVVSFRDGDRCGETIKSIFENAKNPDKIIIGLAEQNAPADVFCMEQYCAAYGAKIMDRQVIRADVTKIMRKDQKYTAKCPRFDQVRKVTFYHVAAKGPMFARSMVRKVLGNEEFCMQVDSHTDFVQNWDEIAIREWKKTENEFGVISNVPERLSSKDLYRPGSDVFSQVPRQCRVTFKENGVPDYEHPADGKVADLERPLLSYGWSAGFSFAKCHLEEAVPYDPFSHFAMPIEQFPRYARMWTRGYDTYTPTQNIVFHDFEPHDNALDWFKRQKDRFRKDAITRAKTILQLPGGSRSESDQANLGLYGVGKRRTIEQFQAFTALNFQSAGSNDGMAGKCASQKWVPYDATISPLDNLYDKPDNLDPQPIYPLRTKTVFYQQVVEAVPKHNLDRIVSGAVPEEEEHHAALIVNDSPPDMTAVDSNLPSVTLLLILWFIGIVVWCAVFMNPQFSASSPGDLRKRRKASSKDI